MGDTRRAVVEGLARAARVITAAAAIMMAVFGAFVLSGDVFLKLIGAGWSPRFSSTRPSCAWWSYRPCCRRSASAGGGCRARSRSAAAGARASGSRGVELANPDAVRLLPRPATPRADYFLWSTTQVL